MYINSNPGSRAREGVDSSGKAAEQDSYRRPRRSDSHGGRDRGYMRTVAKGLIYFRFSVAFSGMYSYNTHLICEGKK